MTQRTKPTIWKPLVAALVATATLVGCGGSNSSDSSSQTDDAASAAAAGDASTADEDASGPDESEVYTNSKEPSGGHLVDERWPDEVWLPEDITLTGKNVNIMGDDHYSEAFGLVDSSEDDVRNRIIGVNGPPDKERTRPDGTVVLEYPDLMPGHHVSYSLAGEPGSETGLIVGIGAK